MQLNLPSNKNNEQQLELACWMHLNGLFV